MTEHSIEQWEQTQAELEIRRWLYSIGQWAPEAERQRPPQQATGPLNDEQIDAVLDAEVIGRIGCHAHGRTYVVPVLYAYDGTYVYGHTNEGQKLRMMRSNPSVCFEVEQVNRLRDWRTVIATGHFEELHGDAADRAEQLLVERLKPLFPDGAARSDVPLPEDLQRAVVFRIELIERSGRSDKR